MLAIVMVGAAATQIMRGGRNGVGEIVFMCLLLVVAAVRWRDRIRARIAGTDHRAGRMMRRV